VRAVVEQVADQRTLQADLLSRLRGQDHVHGMPAENAKDVSEALVESSAETATECSAVDMLLVVELCSSCRFRDFARLARLADRFLPDVPLMSTEVLLRLGTAYAALGALNAPLFDAVARALLVAWHPDHMKEPPRVADLAEVARAFAAQRLRHEELLDRLAALLVVTEASPDDALSLLRSHALLRADSGLGDLWSALEQQAAPGGFATLGHIGRASGLCHALLLSRRADSRLEDLCELLEALAGPLLGAEPAYWTSGEGRALHNRCVLLRSAMRYLYRDTYSTMSLAVKAAFRRIHRMELPERERRPMVHFVKKLSRSLEKLRIGHHCMVERGPFVLDIVERDRKVVWECNHFDKFYAGTNEKIAAASLQERIVKMMGYRVVQIPHWQWNKVRHKRQRLEYVRMSRYYAIKDRREFSPSDEPSEDVVSSAFDNLGEYFFRKDRPSAPFSWFQPRYDASNRLPQV